MKLLIDGKIETSLAELMEINDGLYNYQIRLIEKLKPGQGVTFSGGGFSAFTVERIGS